MYQNKELDRWISENVMGISLAESEDPIPYSSSMEYSFLIRTAMKDKGFYSEDRYCTTGWGRKDGQEVYGYCIWFKQWQKDENGKSLGVRLIGMGAESDPEKFARAVCSAAKMALINPKKG